MYPTVKSVFTLALLEDTGWYFADFTRADMALKWGYNLGCDFLHSCDANIQPGFCMNHASPSPDAEECSSDASWVDSEGDGCRDYFDHPWWCDNAEDWAVDGVDASVKCCACRKGAVGFIPLQCSFDRSAVGHCAKGGSFGSFLDGCQIVRPKFRCSEGPPANLKCGKENCQGQEFTNSSSCFETSLFLEGYEPDRAAEVGCYESRCLLKSDSTYSLQIKDPLGSWHICDKSSKAIKVPGYSGSILCPLEWQAMCTPPDYGLGPVTPIKSSRSDTTAGPIFSNYVHTHIPLWAVIFFASCAALIL